MGFCQSLKPLILLHFFNPPDFSQVLIPRYPMYHITSSFSVKMPQIDILVEPPYGPICYVSVLSFLGFVKASGHEKSLVTTAFRSYKANVFRFAMPLRIALGASCRLVHQKCQQDVKGRCKWTNRCYYSHSTSGRIFLSIFG